MNYFVLHYIVALTEVGVDVFMLITGYFMCTSNSFTIQKPVALLVQVVLFDIIYNFAKSMLLTNEQLTVNDILYKFFRRTGMHGYIWQCIY